MFSPKRMLLLTLLVCFPATLPAADAEGKKQFLAGSATSNITPPLGEPVVGGWAPEPATNIHDELHARCLVLNDGSTKVAFVICDILYIARDVCDEARQLIADETDIPAENILIAGTHTHSATPATSENYRPFLVRRIADGVRRALVNQVPARIGWGSVDEPREVFNRRWYTTDPEQLKNPFGGMDKVRMNPSRGSATLVRPAGPIDPEVSFISVQTVDGEPLSLLANYSLHYVGGVRRGEVSADYFGVFSRRIAKLLGAAHPESRFVGMMSNGTSGDINNINFREKSPRQEPYEQMTKVGELLAQRVYDAQKDLEYQDWVPLGVATRELTLKHRKPDEAMQKYFAEIMEQPEDKVVYHRHERTYAGRVQKLLEGPDSSDILLQVIRIGDLSIPAIPFETFAEIGLELKEKSPFADTFTIELANGAYGYLPTPEQHELGGYETWMGTNRVQLDASERITEVLFDLMDELRDTQKVAAE
ncbi:hypothetical protein [Rubinisphaera margarita]|uniref:hypothetical protein n=1 Tax=Rubinisphaera margarita TaxID=2909586 RepID=UPI001EE9716E|nr:hypothetical protein [Rubinisphaera margarita]MCG6155756.1 hypothetical protein [Rubinisphaera margarita]